MAFSVVFSKKAEQRLQESADYLFIQTQTAGFAIKHLNRLETYLRQMLTLFSRAGTPMANFGEGIQRLAYQKYSIFSRVTGQQIEILTCYRNNLH